jgi:hypothetical protein
MSSPDIFRLPRGSARKPKRDAGQKATSRALAAFRAVSAAGSRAKRALAVSRG